MIPKKPWLRLLVLFVALLGSLPHASAGSILFNFTIPAGATTTSAGVFAPDGTLLRTLWSNEIATPGDNSAIWDGLDDEGQPLTPGSYTVKVLHSQVSHTWEGTLGNTSTDQTGETVRRSFQPTHDLIINGSDMFFAYGYNEGKCLYARSVTSDPNQVTYNGRIEGSRNFYHAATDGTRVYYTQTGNGLNDLWPSFVVAYNIGDNSQHLFSAGIDETSGQNAWDNVIDLQFEGDNGLSGRDNAATGIAVQPTGNYLFVSHAAMNEIRVFNKTTGAYVEDFTMTAPGRVIATRDNAALWVIVTESGARVVRRYNIDGSGNLTSSAVITGLADPIALAISPDNTTLLVADGGSSQQVKAFNNASSGTQSTALWTLGQAGGYPANGTAVASDKFMFRNAGNSGDVVPLTYIAFQSDGSFWVGDTGNERILKFSASRVYQNEIMYLSHTYMNTVCYDDPTRVFAGWMEFTVDYSQPVNQGWTYVRNWSATLPVTVSDVGFAGFSIVKKFGGRTFGVAGKRVYELQSSGVLRDTGILFTNEVLHEDGSLRYATTNATTATYFKKDFASLNGSNNPTWGSAVTLATSPITATNPKTNTGGRGGAGMRHPSTTSGLVIFSDGSDARFHLAGVPAGTGALKWRTAQLGTYFDKHGTIGIMGDYPANNAYTNGNHIVFAAHGEGATDIYSRTYQANQFLHYWHNGLMIGQFGSPLNYLPNPLYPEAPWLPPGLYPGRAGNALSGAFVTAGAGLYYWHCDESQASGLHRWKINNPTSVQEIPVGVTLPSGSNGTGITGQFFNGTNPATYTWVSSGTDPSIDFNWGMGAPAAGVSADNFSVRWTGLVEPLYSQTYTFTVNKASGNNARLYVGGTLVADGWTTTGTAITGTIALTTGVKYPVILEYRDPTTGGAASVSLKWQSSSQALEVVPYRQLFPSDVMSINFGGGAIGRFEADPLILTSSVQRTTTNTVTTTGLFDPAPMAVYQDARQGALGSFGIVNLAPYTQYRVRMHFAEIDGTGTLQGVGKRVFSFRAPALNVDVRNPIDIYAEAGGGYKGLIHEDVMSTDNAGHLRIGFGGFKPLIGAVEIYRDPSNVPAFATIGTGNGLKGEYFSGTAFNTLEATRLDNDVNFSWTTTNPPPGSTTNTNYTVRWTGKVLTTGAGTYTFRVEHGNGARLWVNNLSTPLIDQWSTSGGHSATITLAGSTQYDIKLEYLQTTGTANVALKWNRPNSGSAIVLIPRSQLYTSYAPPASSVEVILDNTSGAGVSLNGGWTTSTGNPGYYGINYAHDGNTGKGAKSVVYTPTLPVSGTYEVYARWPAWASASNAVPVSIVHTGGTASTTINNRVNGGTWNLLGTYTFNAGTAGYVTISNTGTSNHVFADAVRFYKP
ncbi:MAG: PA14 domain-containing protein [Rariglobus sp.]